LGPDGVKLMDPWPSTEGPENKSVMKNRLISNIPLASTRLSRGILPSLFLN
jgi:hypothetical protein